MRYSLISQHTPIGPPRSSGQEKSTIHAVVLNDPSSDRPLSALPGFHEFVEMDQLPTTDSVNYAEPHCDENGPVANTVQEETRADNCTGEAEIEKLRSRPIFLPNAHEGEQETVTTDRKSEIQNAVDPDRRWIESSKNKSSKSYETQIDTASPESILIKDATLPTRFQIDSPSHFLDSTMRLHTHDSCAAKPNTSQLFSILPVPERLDELPSDKTPIVPVPQKLEIREDEYPESSNLGVNLDGSSIDRQTFTETRAMESPSAHSISELPGLSRLTKHVPEQDTNPLDPKPYAKGLQKSGLSADLAGRPEHRGEDLQLQPYEKGVQKPMQSNDGQEPDLLQRGPKLREPGMVHQQDTLAPPMDHDKLNNSVSPILRRGAGINCQQVQPQLLPTMPTQSTPLPTIDPSYAADHRDDAALKPQEPKTVVPISDPEANDQIFPKMPVGKNEKQPVGEFDLPSNNLTLITRQADTHLNNEPLLPPSGFDARADLDEIRRATHFATNETRVQILTSQLVKDATTPPPQNTTGKLVDTPSTQFATTAVPIETATGTQKGPLKTSSELTFHSVSNSTVVPDIHLVQGQTKSKTQLKSGMAEEVVPPRLTLENFSKMTKSGVLFARLPFAIVDESAPEILDQPDIEATIGGLRENGTQMHTLNTASPIRHEALTSIARQMVEIIRQSPNSSVEISLNPQELGRLRMSMTVQDSGITLSLVTERPETLDLLRKHIDQLGQEFHALGYNNVNFSFAGNERDPSSSDQQQLHTQPSEQDEATPEIDANSYAKLSLYSGLDLRL